MLKSTVRYTSNRAACKGLGDTTPKNISIYTCISAKCTTWILHLLFIRKRRPNSAGKVSQKRAEPSKTKPTAEGGGTGLIGNPVLEMPHSDSKRPENSFCPEHHEQEILLPGMALTWRVSLQILMKRWEMVWSISTCKALTKQLRWGKQTAFLPLLQQQDCSWVPWQAGPEFPSSPQMMIDTAVPNCWVFPDSSSHVGAQGK